MELPLNPSKEYATSELINHSTKYLYTVSIMHIKYRDL